MSIAIRELGLADQIMLEELLDACHPGWSDQLQPGASGPLAFLADRAAFAIGGYVDNEPAGLLWGVHVRRPDGTVMAYVDEIDVSPEHRRRGVATMLLEAALGLARSEGNSVLWLSTRSTNVEARGLYGKLGGRIRQADEEVHFLWEL